MQVLICVWLSPLTGRLKLSHLSQLLISYVLSRSVASDSAASWVVARQVPLPMGFSRQEDWSEVPFPTPEIFLFQGWNPCPLHLLHWQP